MRALIVEYIVIMVVYVVERDWARAAYFLGSAIISLAVLWMK
jgi:hypothetical protein